jgi:hypothetical protein
LNDQTKDYQDDIPFSWKNSLFFALSTEDLQCDFVFNSKF